MPDQIINKIVETFNVCMRKGVFPVLWKTAKLVLIPKGNSQKEEPKKYRPLCLLDDISKSLERIIADRINYHLADDHNAELSDRQYGFRANRSTCDAIARVKQFSENAMVNEKKCVVAIGIDIENAFNTLPWLNILKALRKKKIPNYIIRIISSYLSERFISYIGNDGKIHKRRVYAGVPQGSVLGPLLWNITYDEVIRNNPINNSEVICYADDTIVLVKARNPKDAIAKAKTATELVISKITKLGLKVATKKTEAILFQLNSKIKSTFEIDIMGDLIR